MTLKTHIKSSNRPVQVLSVLLMCFCIVFLTGVNFIIYNPSFKSDFVAVQKTTSGEDTPPAPVEERSSSASVNILEELLHEHHFHGLTEYLDALSIHQVHEAAKLSVVHFELISPPPDLLSC